MSFASSRFGQRSFIHQFTSNASTWAKREYKRGFSSPLTVVCYFAAGTYIAYRLVYVHYLPWKKSVQERPWRVSVPFADSHNAFFGIMPAHTTAHDPASIASDRSLDRPTFVASERSSLYDGTSMVVMQSVDYDDTVDEEVYYRSLHMLADPERSGGSGTKIALSDGGKIGVIPHLPTLAEGEDYVHAMLRCKTITTLENCFVDDTRIPLERHRKLLTALGPMFMLQHPLSHYCPPLAFSRSYEKKQDVLVLGMGGGTIPMFLSKRYPFMRVDVVEPDAVHARVSRHYLGFRENPKLKLFVQDPAEFIRRNSAEPTRPRYDMIFMDIADARGYIPEHLTRLEFLSTLRESMGDRGVVACAIPTLSIPALSKVVSAWRNTFEGRAVLLLHCGTEPHSILLAFQDAGKQGHPQLGNEISHKDYKDLVDAFLSHFKRRMSFDLSGEVTQANFELVRPGQTLHFQRKAPPLHHMPPPKPKNLSLFQRAWKRESEREANQQKK